MSNPPENALITGFLTKTKDRFHEYNVDRTFEERMALAASIDGITGVEIVRRYEVRDAALQVRFLREHSLSIAAVNPNVKAEPEFRNGGVTSTDMAVRAKAVEFIKAAKDFAKRAGADKVTCCPLGDGYEFNFHCDYRGMWRHAVDSFSEAASFSSVARDALDQFTDPTVKRTTVVGE